jgi:hypothetical protein
LLELELLVCVLDVLAWEERGKGGAREIECSARGISRSGKGRKRKGK